MSVSQVVTGGRCSAETLSLMCVCGGQGKIPGAGSNQIYYHPEVSSIKYCYLGIFRKEYFRLITK